MKSKFFKHYKDKPYKFLGSAIHTETMEKLVLYETRYESAAGKTWVRPNDMFFENIEKEGRLIPRFREVPLQIQETTQIQEAELELIAQLMKEVFGSWDSSRFFRHFEKYNQYHFIVGRFDNELAGFKLGHKDEDGAFYSWLGGVLPKFRGLSVAKNLMIHQHEWCKKQNYKIVRTKTQNKFREMLLLNIRLGFEVKRTEASQEGGMEIILEKSLA